MERIGQAAAIGGGVIGGGWVARLLLNGIDVRLYDPAPDAAVTVAAMIENAERAYGRLVQAPLPPMGRLELTGSIAEAVRDVPFVQESAPENLSLKREILGEVDAHAPSDALICSSTSGLLPSRLQEGMARPERLLVGHPFNPVYLLPLVEICGGERTAPDAAERAAAIYRSLGMAPLILRKEIDAFIADRLLEALWREALWLVNDEVATVEEIDDAVRFGAGLRWALMGTFQTYRLAGGEAGMRHFLSQFGPALEWPWTKLTDVPALTDDLIDRIATQSDAQAQGMSLRALERKRDDGLVAILQALRAQDWAAGATLKAYESDLRGRAPGRTTASGEPSDYAAEVRPDWVDYNGHMTESGYTQVFGDATDAFLSRIGMDRDYLDRGHSVYTVESHVRHLREVAGGEPLAVATQLLGYDQKRIRILHEMHNRRTGDCLATSEHMLLHVSTAEGKACAMGPVLVAGLQRAWTDQGERPKPAFAGRGIRVLESPAGGSTRDTA